jgi:hypothetical protein
MLAAAAVLAVTLYLVWPKADHALDEVRRLAASERTVVEGGETWHEFQFAEPFEWVGPKLRAWKAGLEKSGRAFSMTDAECSEFGPHTWARDTELALKQPIELDPGMHSAFAISITPRRTWIGTVLGWFTKGHSASFE